jgi:hypothetical protein
MKHSYLFLIVSIVFVGFSTGKVRFPHRHRYKQAVQNNYTYVTEYFVQKVIFGEVLNNKYIAEYFRSKIIRPEPGIVWQCNSSPQ